MIEELLRLYDESLLNEGQPKSSFNPTLIFNEGWLLRYLMRQWKLAPAASSLAFLPFPADATIYSEGQLYTPFTPRFLGDKLAESHTHADGIAGDFSIGSTKSGVDVDADCRYLTVFEAKLNSPIAGGTTHAPGYDQVSRTVACIINSLLRAGCPGPCDVRLVVLHPKDSGKIHPEKYSKDYLVRKIAARGEQFGLSSTHPFTLGWRTVLDTVNLSFVTWEEALAERGDEKLECYYELCQRFNG